MLRSFRARALVYEPSTDIARIEVSDPEGPAKTVRALLLLDAKGFLVGVDLGGDELDRAVVLLGAYEVVDRTVEADVEVAFGAGAEPAEVRVMGAKRAIRAGEKSPYS